MAKLVLVGNALSLRFDVCYIIVKKARIPKMLFPVILPRAHKQNTHTAQKQTWSAIKTTRLREPKVWSMKSVNVFRLPTPDQLPALTLFERTWLLSVS